VVLLDVGRDRDIVADLGPTSDLKKMEIKKGDTISVRGQPVRIGNRIVLLGNQLTARGQTMELAQRAEAAS
jgi:hypothetical protein